MKLGPALPGDKFGLTIAEQLIVMKNDCSAPFYQLLCAAATQQAALLEVVARAARARGGDANTQENGEPGVRKDALDPRVMLFNSTSIKAEFDGDNTDHLDILMDCVTYSSKLRRVELRVTNEGSTAFEQTDVFVRTPDAPDSTLGDQDAIASQAKVASGEVHKGHATPELQNKDCCVVLYASKIKKLPEGFETFWGKFASFSFKNNLTLEELKLPDSIKVLPASCLEMCRELKSFQFHNTVTTIKDGAFRACSKLGPHVEVPDSVTEMEDRAFDGCSSLESIKLSINTPAIGFFAFWGCIKLKSITIPVSVTRIEEASFKSCLSLTSIQVPKNVVSIGEEAFEECETLEKATISGATTIGDRAFTKCVALTSVTMPKVISIGSGAFKDCTGLTNVTIPGTVEVISSETFAGCTSLTEITIPASVTEVAPDAFKGCLNLRRGEQSRAQDFPVAFAACTSTACF